MIILYNLSIFLTRGLFKIASLFNAKAAAFTSGRARIFKNLESSFRENNAPVIWVHCASLGEFEQGRPLIEAFKKEKSEYKILLTFFSPSGYEVQKKYAQADFIFYLPWDTASNAWHFIEITKPALAIFIKYEFWYHYAHELRRRNIPLLSVSSIFRKSQSFFKWYGGFYRDILKNFSCFFVQNDESLQLLKSIGIQNVKRSGDTRFDRVIELTRQQAPIAIAEKFKDSQHTWVIGSCWPEDFDVLAPFINESENKLKFIIAPHEITETFISNMQRSLRVKTCRYSQAPGNIQDYTVLIIDNVGMLSRLYKLGEFAFVGGAYNQGLHNILEPACYGIPVFFGNKHYQKYQEAIDLINRGGAFEISDYADLRSKYELLMSRPENYLIACEVTSVYVKENLGATRVVMDSCKQFGI